MRIPSIIRRTIAAIQDPEKGRNTTQSQNGGAPAAREHRDARTEETLNHFRYHVGIHNDDELNSGRPVANVGIYQRLVEGEKKYNKQYKTYSALINSALGLQIVFAAALTALGAGELRLLQYAVHVLIFTHVSLQAMVRNQPLLPLGLSIPSLLASSHI